jgi:hypothetical protein
MYRMKARVAEAYETPCGRRFTCAARHGVVTRRHPPSDTRVHVRVRVRAVSEPQILQRAYEAVLREQYAGNAARLLSAYWRDISFRTTALSGGAGGAAGGSDGKQRLSAGAIA